MKQKYLNAFMEMSEVFARTSEATRLQVGALIVKDGAIISVGVNGTPSGYPTNVCEDENGNTHSFVLHAEINALNKLRKLPSTSTGATMFITHAPCLNCSINIVDAGIKQVYHRQQYRDNSGVSYLLERGVPVQQL